MTDGGISFTRAFALAAVLASPLLTEAPFAAEPIKQTLTNREIIAKLYELNGSRRKTPSIFDLTAYGPLEYQLSTIEYVVSKLTSIPISIVPQNAGVANPFVIGGQLAGPNDFPWQIGLLNAQTGILFCGGSYIGHGSIVTAAHCIDDGSHPKLTQDDITVFYGSNNLLSGGKRVPLTSAVVVKQDWDPSTKQNDMALLKIQEPDDLPYVRIPLDAVEAPVVSPGALLTISGWGRTDPSGTISTDLMRTDLPVVDSSTCQSIFTDVSDTQAAQRSGMGDVTFKSLVHKLQRAKTEALISSGRNYDPSAGDWLDNALHQQAIEPFHAIIASENRGERDFILVVGEIDDAHPLMVAPHNWQVERVGAVLAEAMSPLLASAKKVLFVDRFFNIENARYKETLGAALAVIAANGVNVRCEIHYAEHDSRPPPELVEQNAGRWLKGIIPAGMSIALFGWREKAGGADFHARDLLTDRGGMNVEAGFSAEGSHQKVRLSLLDLALCQQEMAHFARGSTRYELVEPVFEISSDGRVRRI
jgi:hypothetical protein